MLGVLGYCIIQFFDFPRERIEMQAVLALLFAWIMFYSRPVLQSNTLANGIIRPAFFALMGIGLAFNLLIGWNRMAGEKHNVRMLEAQAKGDWKTLAKESVAAENPYYKYTEVGIPLAWHEGIAWYQLKQMDKAVVAFEKAYKLNPWSFQVMNNYASALVQTNQFREAIPLFEQALTINPRFDDGKLNVSFAYFQLGEYEKAREWIERVDTIPNPANDDDRRKNQQIKTRQADFRKAVQEKMK
jgi:tetratricopeptide (TPR) repeat protein